MPKFRLHAQLIETTTTLCREFKIEAADIDEAKEKLRRRLHKDLEANDYDTDDWKDGGGCHIDHVFDISKAGA